MAKKRAKQEMGDYNPNEREMEAYLWCVRNDIRIAPKPVGQGAVSNWYVDIFTKKGWVQSPNSYPKIEIWEAIFKFNLFYYEKAKKKRQSTSG